MHQSPQDDVMYLLALYMTVYIAFPLSVKCNVIGHNVAAVIPTSCGYKLLVCTYFLSESFDPTFTNFGVCGCQCQTYLYIKL